MNAMFYTEKLPEWNDYVVARWVLATVTAKAARAIGGKRITGKQIMEGVSNQLLHKVGLDKEEQKLVRKSFDDAIAAYKHASLSSVSQRTMRF